jgi:hypothetical protein
MRNGFTINLDFQHKLQQIKLKESLMEAWKNKEREFLGQH